MATSVRNGTVSSARTTAPGARNGSTGVGRRCAIVGSGLSALITFVNLRHSGVPLQDITVFGPHDDPAQAWWSRAGAIRQRTMRSESDGHCGATAFPGLAVREARRRRRPQPLLLTVLDRYRPSVEVFLEHVNATRTECAWDERFRRRWVERVVPVSDGFLLDDDGPYQHVMLALGHSALSMPAEYLHDPRAVHAYEPHDYGREVAVVGAGMAAATEWLNALAAGAAVRSVRRREPARRPLNLPRPMFTHRGLAAYHRLPADARVAHLREWLSPSYPAGRLWDEPLRQAEREGRYSVVSEPAAVDQIICATGFVRGFSGHPVLCALVEHDGVDAVESWIVLESDCSVRRLSNERRTLAVAGVCAQWAFPAADTLVGARYAAHHFVRRVLRCRIR